MNNSKGGEPRSREQLRGLSSTNPLQRSPSTETYDPKTKKHINYRLSRHELLSTLGFLCSQQEGGFTPANALRGFEGDSTDELLSTPPDSPLLGFAMDGRRLYGPYDSTNSLAWGLDICNGRWEEQVDDGVGDANRNGSDGSNEAYVYTYRATPSFPYLIGCWGPAGAPLEATAAAAPGDAPTTLSASGDFAYTEVAGGFLLELAETGCPAGSFLSVDSGECEACRAGTYGKDAGLVGLECPGVS